MLLKPALAVRWTVAGHGLGALEGGGNTFSPSNASLCEGHPPAGCDPKLCWSLPDAPLVACRRLLDALKINASGKAHVWLWVQHHFGCVLLVTCT